MHLVLALDGAEPKLARKYFKKIKELGEIKDYITYSNTGPSFGTVITGLPPEKHGIMDLSLNSDLDHIRGTFIWERVSCKFGIANIPLLWPPKKINGWMVCGMMAPPGKIYTYPLELTEELNKIGYKIWPENPEKKTNWVLNIFKYLKNSYIPYFIHHPLECMKEWRWKYIKATILPFRAGELSASTPIDNKWWDNEWRKLIKKRTEGFLYLLNKYPVDIALLCYKALDCIQHRFFHDKKIIEKWYKIQDREIEKLLKNLKEKPETITIFSDHGFKRIEHGYITGTHRPIGMFLSTIENNVERIDDIYNFIVRLSNEKKKV